MRKFYTLILLLSLSLVYGQAPNINWLKNYGGSSSEYANVAIQTSDGGYIVAGSTYSSDGDITSNKGGQDVWILKLDSSGDLEWQKTYGGSGTDFPTGIAEIAGEGYVVAAYTDSNDGDVSGNHGSYDMWVFKINTSGTLIWQKTYGGTDRDFVNQMTSTSDGGFILAGTTRSINGDIIQNKGLLDIWLVKIDTNGTLLWQKTYGGNVNEQAYNIKPTLDGNFVACGYSTSTFGDFAENKGNSDLFVIKFNNSGVLLWETTFGGGLTENGRDILPTADGGYIVMGDTTSSDGDVSNKKGVNDFWVIKMDGSGNLVWEKTYGGAMEDVGYSITSDPNGGYVLAGETRSPAGDYDVSVRIGGYDIWLFKIDDNGNLIWDKTIGGTNDDSIYSIFTTNDNNFFMCGSSRSVNGDMVSNNGIWELWVAKTGDGQLSVNDLNKTEFYLYPNPANDLLFVKSKEKLTADIYNIIGKKMLSAEVSNQIPINISQLTKGIYIVKLKNQAGKTSVKKLIIDGQ